MFAFILSQTTEISVAHCELFELPRLTKACNELQDEKKKNQRRHIATMKKKETTYEPVFSAFCEYLCVCALHIKTLTLK